MRRLLDVQPPRHLGLCAVKTFKKTAGIPVVVELVEKPLP